MRRAGERGRVWRCQLCGFTYRADQGLPEDGIAAGTPWEAIPSSWICPDCQTSKASFDMVEIDDDARLDY